MNQYVSEKLRILPAVSILLVLYIHSGFHANEINGMPYNYLVQGFISGLIGRCAVPLFYIISGYLFFCNTPNGLGSVFEKMRKRVRTLLIPYIIAAIFFVALHLFIDSMPGTSRFVNSSIFSLFKEDWSTILYSIFYDAGSDAPLAFQLWFLRDLILLVALAPLWYYLLKYLKWGWVAIALLLTYFPNSYFPFYALFWFSLGGILTSYDIKVRNPRLGIVASILFLILCFWQLFYPDPAAWEYAKVFIILLGITAVWFVYEAIIPLTFSLHRHPWLQTVCSFTFFIYLFHEPTLNIVRKLIVYIIGKTQSGYMLSYLVSPWIFAFITILIGSFLKKTIPNLYKTAVGGR